MKVVESPRRTTFDYILFAVSVLLGVVGVSGIGVGICTLRKIERQTAASEKQATHMVESERPFLTVEVAGDENHATFKVSNCGRSPAKILFMDKLLSATYLPVGEKPPFPPEYGNQYRYAGKGAELLNAEWVMPRSHTFIGTVSPKSELANVRSSLQPDHQIGPCAIWHYGVVVYKGLFGDRTYESRYCYRLLSNHWAMLGNAGYNEYT